MVLMLTDRDVQGLLTMEMALEAVEAAFRGLSAGGVNHPRRRVPLAAGMLNYMASSLPSEGAFGLKLYPTTGRAVEFLVPLYSAETGRLIALIEADTLGRLRTGAASGVATRYMARPDAQTLGLIGTGSQARTQMLAICAVRPIQRVYVYSRSAAKRAEFLKDMAGQVAAEIVPVDHARAAVEAADVVATMTTASQPVFDGAWLKPGAHVNAAGSNHLLRREIDAATVQRCARIAADSVAQAQMECGDLAPAVEAGLLRWEDVLEMADIVAGRVSGRAAPDEITLFESHGLAAWDVATAIRVYARAVERGVGQKLALFEDL